MKKSFAIIALAALVMLAGCKKNDPKPNGTRLIAGIEKHKSDSKTSLDGLQIKWTAGDLLYVYDKDAEEGAIFTLSSGEGTSTGEFTGTYNFTNENVAVYPSSSFSGSGGTIVTMTLPAVQTASGSGTFGNGANPMLGVFSDFNNLTLKSLCGVLCLQLTGNNVNITAIEIVGGPDDKLNGTFTANYKDTDPVLVKTGDDGNNTVRLNCPATLTSTAQKFYVVLPANTLANGFTMKVYNGTNVIFSKSTTHDITMHLNTIETMDPVEVAPFNPYTTALTFEAKTAPVNVEFGNGFGTATLEYSTDGGEHWYPYSSTITLENDGDMVSFHGSNSKLNSNRFSCTGSGSCYIYGNVMSLLDASGFATTTNPAITDGSAFYSLFGSNIKIDIHPNKDLVLPATDLDDNCYNSMFSGCTGLTKAPALPATQLADRCYQNMFNGCSSLQTAPALPATELADYCYSYMFQGCQNLTEAPELPSTDLAKSCYLYMFNGCVGLTTAPELPATTLAKNCYSNMFQGCTSLTTAPDLLAPTLVADCYYFMFFNCSQLNSIKCLATTNIDGNTNYWVGGNVPSSGTFTKASGVTWPTMPFCGIPDGWTVIDQ